MAEVMVRDLMTDDECNLLVRRTKLIEPPSEIDVAPRPSERRGLLHPWDFHKQAIRCVPLCLQTILDPPSAVDGPSCVLKAHRFVNLAVQPLAETLTALRSEERRVGKEC